MRLSPPLALPMLFYSVFFGATASLATTEGNVTGTLRDADGRPMADQVVELSRDHGPLTAATKSDQNGDFHFFNVPFGDYEVRAPSHAAALHGSVHVTSNATSMLDLSLPATKADSVVVVGRRASAAVASVKQVSRSDIAMAPQGDDISLPKLIATTTPGVVQGPFGQTFIRGNHANIQYQIDGVQLPDSPSNTFGEAFSPRNIDHMEVMTGGIPAEYGERLAAVVNIITKSGTQTPSATVGASYGSYDTVTPSAQVSGSSQGGGFRYFLSGSYNQTDRGLDTPQPRTETDASRGGQDLVHDHANNDSEFLKFDWVGANDSLSLIGFNQRDYFQIPTYPSSFRPTDAFFQPGFADQFGNGAANYVPTNTDDDQTERNRYVQLIFKHTLSGDTYFQIAPYWKAAEIRIRSDPTNDLAAKDLIAQSTPSSFAEDKRTDNFGLKGDFTTHPNSSNKVKAGFQYQTSRTSGPLEVISAQGFQPAGNGQAAVPSSTLTSNDNGSEKGEFEAFYLQDEITATQRLTLSLGLRFDATQFQFADVAPKDQLLQPRAGASVLLSSSTKLHLFYGKLFQPAPAENLRDTFNKFSPGGQQLTPYDIKAEKDDYYEVGLDQALGATGQTASATYWYKNATNMLDDAQLLNTSIAQPYNYAHGFAYGTELAISGQISAHWSDFANYSYEIAQGKGISGGLFALADPPGNTYTYLDHCQINTGNLGVRFASGTLWWALQSNYGSGLRTGPDNSKSLPSHVTEDTTIGYQTGHSGDWLSGLKISADLLNLTDSRYAISVANGFNGSHYAAGRELFVHLAREI